MLVGFGPSSGYDEVGFRVRIRQIIGSALWLPLVVCLSILAATIDLFPDLPALRQAAVGSQVYRSVSHHAETDSTRVTRVREWSEIRFSWEQCAVGRQLTPPATDRNFMRHESDPSPPSTTPI